MASKSEKKAEQESGFVLRAVGYELEKWVVRKESNPEIIAEMVGIHLGRLLGIFKGQVSDVTLKEISDIAYYLNLEFKASVTKG